VHCWHVGAARINGPIGAGEAIRSEGAFTLGRLVLVTGCLPAQCGRVLCGVVLYDAVDGVNCVVKVLNLLSVQVGRESEGE